MNEHLKLQRSPGWLWLLPKQSGWLRTPQFSFSSMRGSLASSIPLLPPSSHCGIPRWLILLSLSFEFPSQVLAPCRFPASQGSLRPRGVGPAMSPKACVPYLQVFKDGKLVDAVCLRGRDRWIAGRHADCDIWVGHASTSRRHLEIQVLWVTQELLLVDLESAHGTRVNGEALIPASPFIVNQNDMVEMGASTRSYKVDWVPVTGTEQATDAAASVLERSPPNYGSNASFRCKLGNIQGPKETRKPVKNMSSLKAENALSPTKVPGQRGGRPELPPRTPVRRVPFATVHASALNSRSPQAHSLRKATTLPEKMSPSKVMEDTRSSLTTKAAREEDGPERSASPTFWLRRCSSAPAGDDSGARIENEVEVLPVVSRECSGEDGRSEVPGKSNSTVYAYDELYPTDKENCQPGTTRRKSLTVCDGRQSCRAPGTDEDRQPFTELQADSKWLSKPMFSPSVASSPDSDIGSRSRTLGLPPPQRPATCAMVNKLDSLFGKLKLGGEHRCQWHVVVDTNCLLDTDALKSLKQLEGIREIRIIVPKIVLRELDGLKRRHDIGHAARGALKWIEDCMERTPFWMHVQRSTEMLPVRRTPPSSLSRIRSFAVRSDQGLMSPTNDDHILDCALLFDRSVTDGCVVLLTRDTALKIKAMAEGVSVEDAKSFSESLLSPYSERFLWLGSTAYRPPVKGLSSSPSNRQITGYAESYAALPNSPFSLPNWEMGSKIKLSPKAKGHGKHGVEELWCHYSERPQGLQLVLA